MKNLIEKFNKQEIDRIQSERNFKMPAFKSGDTVEVKYKITEGTNTRLQSFSGIVIAKTKSQSNYSATFTVRRISSGVGVERKFHIHSPLVAEIEVLKRGDSRRAKLYYLRSLTGKAAKIKEKLNFSNS